MKVSTRALLGAALMGALAGTALAQPGEMIDQTVVAKAGHEVRQRVISYGDLNLNHASGAAVLYKRIAVAAGQVCSAPLTGTLLNVRQTRECTGQAISRAVADVNSTELTRYHTTHFKEAQTYTVMR